jgi:hypothetical protein
MNTFYKFRKRNRYFENILGHMQRKKVNFMGHTLRKNCLIEHVNEGKVEGWQWQEDEEEDVGR